MDFINSLTEIQQFYKGKTIFVTGGTGFLGHLLLSKLLRCCPGIKAIYILVREKKSVPPEERFQQLFSEQILEKVKECCPNYKSIIRIMPGDCMKPKLALSDGDLAILRDEVNVVFHVAATINFTAPLHDAVLLNVACTEDLLNIATTMKQLKVFVHVSTVFANYIGREVLEEQFYDMPIDPEKVINLVKQLDKEMVSKIQPTLLGPYPNTYVYTKTLAEGICQKYWSSVPLVLYRPAIVLSTFKDPIPGWINSIHGPVGLFASLTLGVLRTMVTDGNTMCNVVPCDYVINGMIAAACIGAIGMEAHREKGLPEPQRIYNFGSSCIRETRTWSQFLDRYRIESETFPSSKALRTYSLTLNTNRSLYKLCEFLFHLLPAFVFDKMTKSRMLYRYDKLHKLTNTLSSFVLSNWYVKNRNTDKLFESLCERDKEVFFFDLNQLDWDTYVKELLLGVRQYVLKDDLETLPEAKRKRIRLMVWNRLFSFIFTAVFFYMVYAAISLLKY